MRIRKRKVPLPISSLSPVPIWSSDPNLSLMQLQPDLNPPMNLSLVAASSTSFDLRPPYHPSQPSGARVEAVKVLTEEDGKKRSNDSREGSVQLGAEIEWMVLEQPRSSRDKADGGRWFEGDKAFPLKKRRGGIDKRSSSDHEEDKKMKTKLTLAMDGTRKKGRGGAILEGSRCSRVNGRGWRCCQQTLVGYSLCEHHLGKGRLRTMSNGIRNNHRSKAAKQLSNSSLENLLVSPEEDRGTKANEAEMVEDEKKPAIIMSRKTGKLGIFKARSLSSLLGLANEAISMAENETLKKFGSCDIGDYCIVLFVI